MKYSKSDLESMRAECCSHEYDQISGSGDLCDVLYEGCVGWRHTLVDEVVEYWEEHLGGLGQ
jgi:hypothetical protein